MKEPIMTLQLLFVTISNERDPADKGEAQTTTSSENSTKPSGACDHNERTTKPSGARSESSTHTTVGAYDPTRGHLFHPV